MVRGEVVRNDEIEFAVNLTGPIQSRAGELWQARYYSGLSAWEFDTSTVRCDGQRLVLNHSDTVRFTNRRRFPRVAVRGQAMIAYLPFRQSRCSHVDVSAAGVESGFVARGGPADERAAGVRGGPHHGAGRSGVADRDLACSCIRATGSWWCSRSIESTAAGVPGGWGTIAGIGRVRHCQGMAAGAMVAIELTGLSDAEIDELAYITAELSSREDDAAGRESRRSIQRVRTCGGCDRGI